MGSVYGISSVSRCKYGIIVHTDRLKYQIYIFDYSLGDKVLGAKSKLKVFGMQMKRTAIITR